MKNTFKLKSLALSVAVASSSVAALAPNLAQAEVTGNIGLMSEYYFRGISQSVDQASPEFGVDFENESGFYLGLWSAKVGGSQEADSTDEDSVSTTDDDIEYDIYGGYGFDVNGISVGVGFTLYRYLERNWDSAYDELNLSAGYGPVTVMYDVGIHDGAKEDDSGDDNNYSVLSAELALGDFYGVLGKGMDFLPGEDHTWMQLGYSTEIYTDTSIDFSILRSSKEAAGGDDDETTLLLGINKSFGLM